MNRSLPGLAAQLRTGDLPVPVYLEQLRSHFERTEPGVQAFVPEAGRFERLQREAAVLLEKFPGPIGRPPLFGLPVGVKDIFQVEGFITQAGSRLPAEELQGPEAASVKSLKQAGALILGKTAMTEFAYFGPGPTRNPRNPAHTPGGSSSGSAAAVAAGLCPLALGTQTIGSIIRPAAFCGVVGFKPTYERISRAGVIPLSPSVDHVGLFAADVAGVKAAARVMIGNWRVESESRRPVLGTPEGPYLTHASDEAVKHFRLACERLIEAGYEVKPVEAMLDFEEVRVRHNLLVAAEAAEVHAEWFGRYADLYHPKTAELIRRGQAVVAHDLVLARAGRATLKNELGTVMNEYSIDIWLTPATVGPAPHGLEATGDPIMNLPWTHAGLPAVTVPAGRATNGLPLGIQLVGRWQSDENLLAWAQAIEPLLAGADGPA